MFMKAGRKASHTISVVLHVLGCTAGLASVIFAFFYGSEKAAIFWSIPSGVFALHVDALSAFFLSPVFLVMALGSIYGLGYWPASENPTNGRKLQLFYGTLTGGLTLVMIAGDAWSFLIGWEITSLSAFFLVRTENSKSALHAAWIYLIAAHVATLILFAMFGALHAATGSWLFDRVAAAHSGMTVPILILAFIGFGIKAGLMPFHVWLPEAHAAAPSHVSAVLSGVVLKIGIYGMLRIMSFFPVEHWLGFTFLFAGIVSGILGVVFALAQHDLKRLLAYHSIENIGIIFIGLGVGILGRDEIWGALAMAGALLHVWNHAFFKSLLFFAAGSVVHATGTRSIDELGGLMRKLPLTGAAFLVGAVAISGLPPLNGFVSEWLVYIAGFRAVIPDSSSKAGAAILAVPALALIGGLAVACFVKAYSVVFLGSPRSLRSHNAHDERRSMRFAMAGLVVPCFAIGIYPLTIYAPLSKATANLLGNNQNVEQIKTLFANLTIASLIVLLLILISAVVIITLARRSTKTVTWDCGYAAPSARMQYTASSFADPLVRLFSWVVRPEIHEIKPQTLFPQSGSFKSHVPDPVLDRFLVPGISWWQRLMSYAHIIQAGRIQVYIVYIIATLLILLAWSAL
jgi:hydrogenase-4 component B